MKIKIRKATEADISSCLRLLRTPELKHASGVYMQKRWLVKYFGDEFLVADINGKTVGLVYGELLRDSGSLIWGVAVDKRFRGKGIAGQMLDEFERRVRKKHVEWIILYGCATSKAVLHLYSHRGYEKGLCHYEFVKEFDLA